MSGEEETNHVTELKKEFQKKRPNKIHIKLLIKKTHRRFKELLLKNPGGQIQPVLAVFPCFEDREFVSICLH